MHEHEEFGLSKNLMCKLDRRGGNNKWDSPRTPFLDCFSAKFANKAKVCVLLGCHWQLPLIVLRQCCFQAVTTPAFLSQTFQPNPAYPV